MRREVAVGAIAWGSAPSRDLEQINKSALADSLRSVPEAVAISWNSFVDPESKGQAELWFLLIVECFVKMGKMLSFSSDTSSGRSVGLLGFHWILLHCPSCYV